MDAPVLGDNAPLIAAAVNFWSSYAPEEQQEAFRAALTKELHKETDMRLRHLPEGESRAMKPLEICSVGWQQVGFAQHEHNILHRAIAAAHLKSWPHGLLTRTSIDLEKGQFLHHTAAGAKVLFDKAQPEMGHVASLHAQGELQQRSR